MARRLVRIDLPLLFLVLTFFGMFAPGDVMAEVIVKQRVKSKRAYRVLFRYQPVIAVKSVHLAGTFNGWRVDSTAMKERGHSGVYEVELELPFGKHQYKFVLNGGTWVQDSSNGESQPDGNGGFNSVIHVGRRPASSVGVLGDGRLSEDDVIHDPRSLSFASAVDGDRRLVLRIHVLKNDVKGVVLESSGGGATVKTAMRKIAVVAGREVFEARLYFAKRVPKLLRYRFVIDDGGKAPFLFGKNGLGGTRFQLVLAQAGRFETPDWVRDAIFYQIFPDRFCNGDRSNDLKGLRLVKRRPEGRVWTKNDAFLEDWSGKPSFFNFFGGDLKGIESKLAYLKDLGMNTIYLNPIFKAYSNHRYDAADYEAVDPRLGTEEDFKRLCEKAKGMGIRIILDAVFNHTGDKHYAFEDVKKRELKSSYKDWFFVDKFPIRGGKKPSYRCWWDFADLPQLNTKNPKVVSHLMKVAKKWLSLGASGWRLDVPNEVEAVNPKFWSQFRREVRSELEDAYVVGEIWTDALPWLNEDKFDATMNYPARRAVIDFVLQGEMDSEKFDATLAEQRARLPEAAMRVQFNLLGSHDTARLKFVAKGDMERVKLAYGFVFTYLGAPVVYYGDEVGVTGDKDPDCRRTFPWDEAKQDLGMKSWIKKLARVRREERVLRRGLVEPVYAKGSHYGFLRVADVGDEGRPLLVVMNNSGKASDIVLPGAKLSSLRGELSDLLGGAKVTRLANGDLKLSLKARGLAIVGGR